MSDEFEAAGAAIEGGLLAKAVEDESGDALAGGNGQCLNCKSPVVGKYCTNCGQPLHVRRSIGALWADILHGVLHFEGKFWRTIPLLAWKPGDLTRRYIHGERAKFISPMALFLFSIFMMFAVFSFMGSPFSGVSESSQAQGAESFGEAVEIEAEKLDEKIQNMQAELAGEGISGERRDELEEEILNRQRGRNVMAVMQGDEMPYPEAGVNDCPDGICVDDLNVNLGEGWENHWLSRSIMDGLKKINKNPDLLLYKLKANGYKFAWLLIPISLPFVWLTMIGRRGYRFYDHAVFATYSIAFMSLLFITCAVLAALGVSGSIWMLAIFYPPIHMYRQLRHAYQLSRPEAIVRVLFLFIFTIVSIVIFFLILLALGVLG